ncbi:MFS transporter [Glycomyces algeriensis]|uniref:MFS-type transporter YddS n=1 Tax=Glycomyces algeriensis TaxID=256037 RepID=A0A9W6G6T8_9ACTN|nr:MFS transporter [Glycomyces algeriensis]MDA1367970.1 MFS transporter [Glycomyces algeriensis]MDR7349509.1 MFS family permease [Glycomyces algeriensis]GLI42215.1 putative MFS-type transporter YddS [Glycomyces algeriensis]
MTAQQPPPAAPPEIDPAGTAALQQRVLRTLFLTQVLGGLAVGIGIAVGALLIEEMTGSATFTGLAQSLFVGGSALVVVPAVRITERFGRRGGLAFGYGCAVVGTLIVAAAIHLGSAVLATAGYFLLGAASFAGLQSRYAAADLAPAARRGSHLSLIVWATTIGSVAGPSLAGVAERVWTGWFGGPAYVGSMVAIGLLCLLTAAVILVFLRPDPLLTAREISGETDAPRRSIADGYRTAKANPAVRTGVVAAALGHFVMVGVMAMTAVHIKHGMADPKEALSVVGVILGLHIGGMYAFAPIIGRLVDKHGARPVLIAGTALLVAACTVSGSSPADDHVRLPIGLVLLGVGWSAMTVGSAALVTGAITPAERPSTQGFSDLIMGLAAMAAGLASGPIVEYASYGILCVSCAVVALLVFPFLLGKLTGPAPTPA